MYSPYKLGMKPEQFRRLAVGGSVRLSHAMLSGEHEVHLTRTQAARMAKAFADKKGTTLRMSISQLRHHSTHGKGIFSDLVRAAKPWVTKAVEHTYDAIAHKAGIPESTEVKQYVVSSVQKLVDKLGHKFGAGVHQHLMTHVMGGSLFGDILGGISSVLTSPVGQLGMNLLTSKLGAGIPPHVKFVHREYHKMLASLKDPKVRAWVHGSGIFDDILGGVNSVLSSPIGQLGVNLLAKKLGSGVGKKGGSFRV